MKQINKRPHDNRKIKLSCHFLNLVYRVGLKDLGVLRNIFPALVLQRMALLAGVVGWNTTSSKQALTSDMYIL